MHQPITISNTYDSNIRYYLSFSYNLSLFEDKEFARILLEPIRHAYWLDYTKMFTEEIIE
jgi:hypothetical protein